MHVGLLFIFACLFFFTAFLLSLDKGNVLPYAMDPTFVMLKVIFPLLMSPSVAISSSSSGDAHSPSISSFHELLARGMWLDTKVYITL